MSFPSVENGWATDGTTLFVTTNGGVAWDTIDAPTPGTVATLAFVDDKRGWVAGDGRVWQTEDGGKTWNQQLEIPGGAAWKGRTWIQFSNNLDGWVLFTLGQGCASQEPYELLHTADGGQHWELPMIDGSACHPPFDGVRPTPPVGPGGYPVAFASQGSAAWVLVNSTAGGYLDLVHLAGKGSTPVSKGNLTMNALQSATMGLSVVGSDQVWLVTGDVDAGLGRVLHSSDGGTTWERD